MVAEYSGIQMSRQRTGVCIHMHAVFSLFMVIFFILCDLRAFFIVFTLFVDGEIENMVESESI